MININEPYNKGDIKTKEILNIQNTLEDNSYVNKKILIPVEGKNKPIEVLIYNMVCEVKESIERIKNEKIIYSISYYKNDISDNLRDIICFGREEDFNGAFFDKYIKPSESLLTLESHNNNFKGNTLSDPILGEFSTRNPGENTYYNIIKNCYNMNGVNKIIRRLVQRGLEDGSFELPMMVEIKNS